MAMTVIEDGKIKFSDQTPQVSANITGILPNTIYKNGKRHRLLFMTLWFQRMEIGTSAYIIIAHDPTSPPGSTNTLVGQDNLANDQVIVYESGIAIIPPNYYYKWVLWNTGVSNNLQAAVKEIDI